MKNKTNLYIHKGLYVSKFALVLVTVVTFVKVVLIPPQISDSLSPQTAKSTETERNYGDSGNLQPADYSEIVQKNPFAGKGFARGISSNTGMYETLSEELGLKLLGTISGSPRFARAIIEDIESSVADSYKINQEVKGAKIERILEDRIVLLHNGEEKVLWMESSNTDMTEALKSPPVNKSNTEKQGLENINNYLQNKISFRPNPDIMRQALRKANIEPYYEGEQVKGLKINNLEGISGFVPFGLRNGDVICKINKQRLTSKQKAYQILKKAKSASVMNIELSKEGKTRNMLLNLK